MLLGWCNKEKSVQSAPVFAIVDHVKAIYSHLSERLPPMTMQDIFTEHPIIFFTEEARTHGQVLVKGQFISRDSVRWTDPLGLFEKHESALGTLMPGALHQVSSPISIIHMLWHMIM